MRDGRPAAAPSLVAAQPSPPTVRVDVERGASASQSGPGAYRYDVQVPQLVGVPVHGDALDAMIHGVLQRDLGAFLSAAQDAQAPTDLTCASHTVRVTSKLAVLRVDCTSSQAGVARPTTVTHTFNCDLARARILTLQDVFGRGSAYLDLLTTAALVVRIAEDVEQPRAGGNQQPGGAALGCVEECLPPGCPAVRRRHGDPALCLLWFV